MEIKGTNQPWWSWNLFWKLWESCKWNLEFDPLYMVIVRITFGGHSMFFLPPNYVNIWWGCAFHFGDVDLYLMKLFQIQDYVTLVKDPLILLILVWLDAKNKWWDSIMDPLPIVIQVISRYNLAYAWTYGSLCDIFDLWSDSWPWFDQVWLKGFDGWWNDIKIILHGIIF